MLGPKDALTMVFQYLKKNPAIKFSFYSFTPKKSFLDANCLFFLNLQLPMERNFNMVVEMYKEHICKLKKNPLKTLFFSKVYFLMTGTCKYEFNEKYYHKKNHFTYCIPFERILNVE